jgi:integrase
MTHEEPTTATNSRPRAKPLTVKAIENLKPGAARREVPDGEVRGLYLQVFPSGKTSWSFRYRFSGRTRKLTIGASPEIGLKEARDRARKAHVQVANGIDPGAVKRASKIVERTPVDHDLVEKVVAQFLTRHVEKLAPSTFREVTRLLNKDVLPAWRGRRLSEIRRPDVHVLLDSIVDRGAARQASRTLSWLKGLASFAVQCGLIDASPFAGIKPPGGEEIPRDRILADSELRALWEAADAMVPPYSAFIQFLVLTGQRRSEVAGMAWREIDLEAKTWTLPAARAKNGVEHQIPLSDLAVEILKALPRIDGSDFVLTISGQNAMRGFSVIKRRLDSLMPQDVRPWVFHDVRRTVASGMARLGINLPVIEKLLNHVSGSFAGIVGVYQRHSFADEKRNAMERWGRHVEALASGEAANIVPMTRRTGDAL